ncbi:unnamed protein product [Lupinus luteus]|uniref:MULE transposase domain-containing protein n=1 Tax=Lupinus luteus TaxID=3873 RepID=A0AAV1XH26_LUPLU
MTIDVYDILRLLLSNERRKRRESGSSSIFFLLLPSICIISDRGTGLLSALRTELPQWSNAHSVFCIRHIASNFNKEFRDTELKEKIIQMGYELMMPRFERMFDALREKNSGAGA